MGNKDLDKERPRISSSGTDTESIEAAQDGAYIKSYQNDANRISKFFIKTYSYRRQH